MKAILEYLEYHISLILLSFLSFTLNVQVNLFFVFLVLIKVYDTSYNIKLPKF